MRELNANNGKRPSPLQFGDVTMSMLAGSVTKPLTKSEREYYASDNEEEMPLEHLSTIFTTPSYRPIKFRLGERSGSNDGASTSAQADLRHRIRSARPPAGFGATYREHRRRDDSSPETSLASKSTESSCTSGSSQNKENRSQKNASARPAPRSESSQYSYASQPQERFARPVRDRPYPPFGLAPPTPLVRKDPKLIGSSEVYVRRPTNPDLCPICPGGKHRLHQCQTFCRMGIQEKWYRALKAGVCLNCLIHGHSHYTCRDVGACFRCKQRHNSKLCPLGPNNE